MKTLLNFIPRPIRMYLATITVTLLGYAGLSCSSNCVQCYACLPLGAFVLGSLLPRDIKARIEKNLTLKGRTSCKGPPS